MSQLQGSTDVGTQSPIAPPIIANQVLDVGQVYYQGAEKCASSYAPRSFCEHSVVNFINRSHPLCRDGLSGRGRAEASE